ncbi:enoyl-CoA hydratase, mitochondrial-like [Aplysia californica]|uniref:enoyl-CoA hydratase n=1 Tax=Aplysia californica TaxID=6500 RepID=A0ABM1VSI2_APLCA|nr:enoyl-CoA hydratase, mitochondrial-like [Aplysia californica]
MASLGRVFSSVAGSVVLQSCRAEGNMPRIACQRLYSSAAEYENIKVEKRGEKQNVFLIQLNRPKALNTLCDALFSEINAALDITDADKDVGAIVITGSDKAFAAGADIREMMQKTFHEVFTADFPDFSAFDRCRKPILAAVNGFAFTSAAGGSQRLTRAVGKSKSMEMVLTGNRMSAVEAEKAGLVSKVVPVDQLVDETVKTAEKIASYSKTIVAMCKEAVNAGFNMPLNEGLSLEKRYFHATFSTHDRKEGMTAFVEKRAPDFKDC